MSTVDQMMTGVGRYLGDVKAQRPSQAQILHALLIEIQAFYNEANLTGQAWSVDQFKLVVQPNQEDYIVPLNASFGKPLHILTYYPANPSTIERQIDIFEVQNLNTNWCYPQNLAQGITNWDGAPNTAMRMSFFFKGAQAVPTIRVKPIPALTAEYTVLYMLGDISSFMQMTTTPMLPQHHPLIETRTIVQLLPDAEWFDSETPEGRQANSERRREKATALVDIRTRYEHNFKTYVKSTSMSTRLSSRNVYAID